MVTGKKLDTAVCAIGFRSRAAQEETPGDRDQVRAAVARARDGDSEALRFLYVRYCDNVYGYVRSIVRDPHEAEDVTQTVFAKLITSLDKYNDRGTPFFAWLIRLSRNVAIDHLRANRANPSDRVPQLGAASTPSVVEALTVRGVFADLPSQQREVLILRHLVGLSPGEIAERMGRTEGAIHGLHHRGRSTVRRELRTIDLGPSTMPARASA